MKQFEPTQQPEPPAKCLSKAEVYELLKFQVLEMKDLTKAETFNAAEQQKKFDKLNELINSLEELDTKSNNITPNRSEERLQYAEKETQLKNSIEQFKAKVEIKEIELQQSTEELVRYKRELGSISNVFPLSFYSRYRNSKKQSERLRKDMRRSRIG